VNIKNNQTAAVSVAYFWSGSQVSTQRCLVLKL